MIGSDGANTIVELPGERCSFCRKQRKVAGPLIHVGPRWTCRPCIENNIGLINMAFGNPDPPATAEQIVAFCRATFSQERNA
jgi:hypothetical protein